MEHNKSNICDQKNRDQKNHCHDHCQKNHCHDHHHHDHHHHDHCESNLEKYEATHFAEAMVLTCIDYRFISTIAEYLENDPLLADKYDISALAGASLGYNQNKFKSWPITFRQLTDLAIQLHHIKQLIVFDHMDCGAYQLLYPDLKLNTEEERLLHIKNINQFIHCLKKVYPKLIFSGYLVHDNGFIETIVAP